MTGIALAAAFAGGILLGWLGCLLAITAACVWWANSRKWTVPVLVVVLALAGWARLATAIPQEFGILESGDRSFEGEVTGPAFTSRGGQSFRLEIDETSALGDGPAGRKLVICVYGPEAPRVGWGDSVSVWGTYESVRDVSRGFGASLKARSCDGALFARGMVTLASGASLTSRIDRFRQSISDVIIGSADGDRAALLTGLVTGDDGALSGDTFQSFLNTGTTHITAVSGSNFALIVMIAAVIGAVGGIRRRFAWVVITVAGIWAYALMVGLGPPSFRSAIVATLAVGAVLTGRRADFLTLAMVGMAVQLAIRPEDKWTLSFQLSMAASLALVLVLGLHRLDNQRPFWLSAIVATSSAQLATLAVLAASVGSVSLISVPANLVVGPLTAIAFPLAALGGVVGTAFPPLGEAILVPASMVAGAIIGFVDRAGSVPGATQDLGSVSAFQVAVLAALAVLFLLALSDDVRVLARSVARNRASNRLLRPVGLFALVGGILVGIAVRTLVN